MEPIHDPTTGTIQGKKGLETKQVTAAQGKACWKGLDTARLPRRASREELCVRSVQAGGHEVPVPWRHVELPGRDAGR